MTREKCVTEHPDFERLFHTSSPLRSVELSEELKKLWIS